MYQKINVRDVREGEIVSEDFVSGDMVFKKLEENRQDAPIIGYVAMFRLVNGFEKQLYMSVEELESHAKRFSQTYRRGYGPWADQYMKSQMMEKTVLKRLLSKYAPLSVEMRDAIRSDFAVLGENDSVRYIDNEESAIDFEKAQQVAETFADFDEIVNGEEKEQSESENK
jgi:recombination protein RecT